ncbi:MAG: fused MFS/spermidine synthase, partial [Alphaproteobacteria bacterium]|nr:fused MFS/spermidine synthase [Alphaproteobacteria bacterium]
FATAIICHRQLYEARPDAAHLTEFYMLMSLGGVLGGLFVSLVAPLVFSSVFEYPLLLVLGVMARKDVWQNSTLRGLLRQPATPLAVGLALMALMAFTAPNGGAYLLTSTHVIEAGFFGACAYVLFRAKEMALAGLAMVMVVFSSITGQSQERVALRSYFGVLSVTDNAAVGARLFNHGTTVHGAQRLEELKEGYIGKPHPLTYYSPEGGMARALQMTQARLAAVGKQGVIRVIGLGTGSLACYSKPGEDWAYYEIDRDVIKIAQDKNQFTFLSACAPGMKMIEGDARITLNQSQDEKADYLLVDAFSSDSIPVHLITTEAMRLFLSHVKDDGVLTIHVTNRYMDLVPVVAANMKAIDSTLQGRVVDYVPPKAGDLKAAHSIAIVISRSAKSLEALDQMSDVKPLLPVSGIDQWTDDFSNLPGAIIRRLSVTKY